MENYDTLSEAMNALRKQGYTEDFNIKHDYLETLKGHQLFTTDFHIDKFFRFEGMTNPDDQSILYAISSTQQHLKGLLVNGYGLYADTLTDSMLKKLSVH